MKVSICIPAYENADGIRRLLESIKEQTYEDYEVVLTDDSVSDEVSKVARSFIEDGMKNLKYHRNEKRLGPSNNWNHAMDLSSGEYIKIMHHDDWFTGKDSLGRFVSMLDDNPNAVMAFSGNYQVDLSTGSSYARFADDDRLKAICDDYRNIYLAQVIGAPSVTITRRSNLRFDPKLTWIMDVDFYMGILREGESKGLAKPCFACTKEPLINIGTSDTQLTESVRDNGDINIFEYEYIMDKFSLQNEEIYRNKLVDVALEFDKPYEEVSRFNVTREQFSERAKLKKQNDNKINADLLKGRLKALDLKYIGKISFYIGLIIELLLLILEKSSYHNPIESWMMRTAFVFFALKCLCTKYSKREWLIIALLGTVAVTSYFINTKDEIVRIAVFVVAMKDMDIRRTLKFTFLVSTVGMGILMFLSLIGVLGTVLDPYGGYGIKQGHVRVCLGLGSANTLAIMIWALMTLGIYVYHEKMKWWHYALLLTLTGLVYVGTYTRTTMLMMLLTVIGAFVISNVKALQHSKVLCGIGVLTVLGCVGFSIWAAKVSNWHEYMTPFQNKLDDILTGRIQSIYPYQNGGGVLKNWLLFSSPDFTEYFDMGYVRMFFWYGIIPSSLMILILIYMLIRSYQRNDYMGFVMIVMFAVFTTIEAHIVSVYIARNYLLFLAGAYIFTDVVHKDKQSLKLQR